jgi:hypothetical protein
MISLLETEGGITEISLRNARTLLARHGLPDEVELYQAQLPPHIGEHLVEARWQDGTRHTFSGFSWGYLGEGPRGLETFLGMLGCVPPVSLRQIARWPQERFPSLTYVKGEDYAYDASADSPAQPG